LFFLEYGSLNLEANTRDELIHDNILHLSVHVTKVLSALIRHIWFAID